MSHVEFILGTYLLKIYKIIKRYQNNKVCKQMKELI